MVEFTSGKLKQVEALIVPCFQPLYMVKTSVDTLEASLKDTLYAFENHQVADQLPASIKAWLDIEIDNGDHLSDLSQRVTELAGDMPFEVLLVRRCKKARQRRQAQLSQQDNSMLSELSLAEVFDSRLSQLDWQTDEEIARKTRLSQLFTEISVELACQQKQANLPVEKSSETAKIKAADQGVKTEKVEQEDL